MGWLVRLPIPVVGGGGGNFLVQIISTCLPSRRSRGAGVGTLWGNVGGTKSNDRRKSMVFYTCSYFPGLWNCTRIHREYKYRKLYLCCSFLQFYFLHCQRLQFQNTNIDSHRDIPEWKIDRYVERKNWDSSAFSLQGDLTSMQCRYWPYEWYGLAISLAYPRKGIFCFPMVFTTCRCGC